MPKVQSVLSTEGHRWRHVKALGRYREGGQLWTMKRIQLISHHWLQELCHLKGPNHFLGFVFRSPGDGIDIKNFLDLYLRSENWFVILYL